MIESITSKQMQVLRRFRSKPESPHSKHLKTGGNWLARVKITSYTRDKLVREVDQVGNNQIRTNPNQLGKLEPVKGRVLTRCVC